LETANNDTSDTSETSSDIWNVSEISDDVLLRVFTTDLVQTKPIDFVSHEQRQEQGHFELLL